MSDPEYGLVRHRRELRSAAALSRYRSRLAIGGVIAVLVLSSGRALAQPDRVEVCRVKVTSDHGPIPEGSERGVKVVCRNHGRVDFGPTIRDGALELVLTTTARSKRRLGPHPLECTVAGPAFRDTATFHCPADPDDAPRLAMKPIRCGLGPRFAGSGPQAAPIALSIGGDRHTPGDDGLYYLSATDVFRLLTDRSLTVTVMTSDAIGPLESTFALRAQECAPDGSSRTKVVPLVVERCAEEVIRYDLSELGFVTDDIVQLRSAALVRQQLPVLSSWPQQLHRTPRISSVSGGVIEVVWPADHLCRHTPGGAAVRLRLELPELGRALHLARDGGADVQRVPAKRPAAVGRRAHAPPWMLRLDGDPPGSPLVLLVPGGRAVPITDRTFRVTGDDAPALLSLTKTIARDCHDDGGVRVCAIVDRPDFGISVRWGSRRITAPFDDRMRLHLLPGGSTETLEGGDLLRFAGHETRRRIDGLPGSRWPALLVAPGYLWRVATGELTTALALHVDKRELVTQELSVVAASRLRDLVYWALRSHGWSGPGWLTERKLDRHDPISQIATLLAWLPDGAVSWDDYLRQLPLLSSMEAVRRHASSDEDPLLRLHVSAAALLLQARTSSGDAKAYARKACGKASTASLRLSRDPSRDPSVRLDLELVRMEACLCAGVLTTQDVLGVMRDHEAIVETRPYYLEHYLDLKAKLKRGAGAICKSVAGRRATRR